MPNKEDFYTANNGRFEYEPNLPFVVVNVNNKLTGRFPNKAAAELYLEHVMIFTGRIIDTNDKIVAALPELYVGDILRIGESLYEFIRIEDINGRNGGPILALKRMEEKA